MTQQDFDQKRSVNVNLLIPAVRVTLPSTLPFVSGFYSTKKASSALVGLPSLPQALNP